MNNQPCPCGTTLPYSQCCKKAHDDIFSVTTAEQLMRSRYSAYVLAIGDYLWLSHHSSTRPKKHRERKETIKWAKSVQWMKLDVLRTVAGAANDTHGEVHFKAYFSAGGHIECIDEHSTFCKENGHWVYLDKK